jgi:Rrf2 family transcriptional regulator, iron-sulfur cluster assembly transcription factor
MTIYVYLLPRQAVEGAGSACHNQFMNDRFRRGNRWGRRGGVRQADRGRSGCFRAGFPSMKRGLLPSPARRACASATGERPAPSIFIFMVIIIDDDYVIFFVDLGIILIDYDGMLSLSQTTGYAVRALICLDQHRDQACLIRNVAACAGIPKPYLARIINDLTYKGLVTARRGCQGGIALARPAGDISLLQIVEAVEGPDWIAPCLFGLDDCASHKNCPIHKFWQRVSKQLKDLLGRTMLTEVMPLPKGKQARRRPGTRRVAA